MTLAHGIGTRTDLPIPASLAAIAAGLAVAASFVGLVLLWRRARLAGERAGRPAPAWVQWVADSAALRTTLQVLTLAASVFVYSAALVGTQTSRNLAPWAFFVTFWVGLIPASLLLGPVWRFVNPLRALHRGVAWAMKIDIDGTRPLPVTVGYWPAAAMLLGFAWFELVFPDREVPSNVGWFLLAYAVTNVSAALVYGRAWFERGDAFEVYSTLLGRLAPLGRRGDGRMVWRNPLQGLDTVAALPGLVAVVVVLIGSTSYDGLTRSRWYVDNVAEGVGQGTAALLICVLLVWLIHLAGTWASTVTPTEAGARADPAAFAHSLVPVAAAYAVAHYFSLLIFDGQLTFNLLSDPYGTGANYFGQADDPIDYRVVSTTVIAIVQVSAIVLGHVAAVASSHDRAVRLFPYRVAVRTQVPLLVAMIGLTLIAIGLVLST